MDNNVKLLKFSAQWCNPCRVLSATLGRILSEFPNVTLKEINIDEDVEQAREYKVRSIPTIVLIKDGQEVDRLVGNQNPEELRHFLAR